MAAAVVAGILAALSWYPMWPTDVALGVIMVLVPASFVATGVMLLSDGQTGRTGWGMIVAAFCYVASWWWTWPDNWQHNPAPLVGSVTGYLWFVTGGLALLRYPEPVLSARRERAYFVTAGIWIVGLKSVLALISRPEWSNWSAHAWWPALAPNRHLFEVLSTIFNVGLIVIALTLPVLLIQKLRRSQDVERIDTLPVAAAASVIGVVGSLYLVARALHASAEMTDALRIITGVISLVAPIAFLASLTQRRLTRAAVADLVVGLAGCSSLRDVQTALRVAIGDPTLIVALRGNGQTDFVSADGDPVKDDGSAWHVPMPGSDGRTAGLMVADAGLSQRRAALVHTAAIAGGLALENDRLHAERAEQLVQVRASRRRIAEAGLAERRRIERDLHDGAQQALLAVSSSLTRARIRAEKGADPTEAIDKARDDLDAALIELRQLARGIHPAVLTDAGLRPALEDVTRKAGMPVELSVFEGRAPTDIESTLYFLTCEALANIIKHANAQQARITITLSENVAIAGIWDDGSGGAIVRAGSGLAGIEDRVHALRGELTITSLPGLGTTITAEIPCG